MRNIILLIPFLLAIQVVCGHQKEIDSLKTIIKKQKGDTSEMKALIKLADIYYNQWQLDSENVYINRGLLLTKSLNYSIRKDSSVAIWLIEAALMYRFSKPDSSNMLAKEALDLTREVNFKKGVCWSLITLGENFRIAGDFPQALAHLFDALRISRDIGDREMEGNSLDFIGIAYVELGEYRQGLNYLFQAKKLVEKFRGNRIKNMDGFRSSYIGNGYDKMQMPDSALFFEQEALSLQRQGQILGFDLPSSPLRSWILTRHGVIQFNLGNQTKALNYYKEAIQIGDILNLGIAQYLVADLFHKLNQPDSSLYYARLAYTNTQRAVEKTWVLEASNLLVKLYKAKNKIDSAFHYQEISIRLNDSLFGPEKFHRLQLLAIGEQQHQQEIILHQKEIQQAQERFENKTKMLALLAIVVVFLLLALLLYRNNRQKLKANIVLGETLSDLKATQTQLIQSEKMASLGELTAGIAHEIQNPLNFVNNFSEVNKELLLEMKDEIDKGNIEEVKTIADDVIDNEEKINHHGRRADAIVKGMLQHSQASTGQKELTDINALTNEYLKLSYHGMRAKDKSFDATLKKQFDETIGKVNIIPQDIGRVLLNLFNNAFYAIAEKKKASTRPAGQPDGYEPTVSVSTKKIGDTILISVRDNGNGIPQKVLDKIFQPFFTTKPTGQGTGLGLSLSYDIIKAHGGELKVQTKEGAYAEFIIILPLKDYE